MMLSAQYWLILLVAWLHALCCYATECVDDHAATMKIPANHFTETYTNITKLDPRTYLITSTQPLHIAATSDLSDRPVLARTSEQSKMFNCQVATNGGPFHADGKSCGVTVTDNAVYDERYDGTGFGHNGTHWVIGTIKSSDEASEAFVTGLFGWLIFDGTNVAQKATKRFGKWRRKQTKVNQDHGPARAPRTAIGLDRHGRVLLLVADGCERCLRKKGPTLHELADLLIVAGGAQYAINLDGGGSTTLVVGSKVTNRPTCLNIPFQCERAVANIVCFKDNKRQSLAAE